MLSDKFRVKSRFATALALLWTAASGLAQTGDTVRSTVAGKPHTEFVEGGPATLALFDLPGSMAVDSTGTLWIVDERQRLARVKDGVVKTLLTYPMPMAVTVGPGDALYMSDGAHVYSVTPAGDLSILAGNGGYSCPNPGVKAVDAPFGFLLGLAIDSAGTIYMSDQDCNRVWKVGRDGILGVAAGTGEPGFSGDGGPAGAATLYMPNSLAFDRSGNLFFSDSKFSRIRKVTPAGTITTIAGNGNFPWIDTPPIRTGDRAVNVALASIQALAVDDAGNVYAQIPGGLGRIGTNGLLTVLAGQGSGFNGDGPLPAATARFSYIWGLALNSAGELFIADTGNHRLRKLSNGIVSTVAGRSHFEGDGGPGVLALLHQPHYTALDSAGSLYFTDEANARIRKVSPGGTISTVVGSGNWGSVPAGVAALNADIGTGGPIAVDSKGTLYFAVNDDPPSRTSSGLRKLGADGRVAVVESVRWNSVMGLAADNAGNIFVSTGMQIVRVAPDGQQTVIAGGNGMGPGCQTGPTLISCVYPVALAAAPDGSLLFAESGWLRKLSSSGKVTLVAGNGKEGPPVEGGNATDSPLPDVLALAADKGGNVYLITRYYGLLRVGADGRMKKVESEWGSDGGSIVVTPSGTLLVADTGANRIYSIGPNPPSRLEIVAGDRQTARAGELMPQLLQVRLLGATGAAIQYAPVEFRVLSPDGAVGGAFNYTDRDGVAALPLYIGVPGTASVVASVPGIAPVTFTVTATEVPLAISPRGIVGPGASSHVLQEVAPNELITVYGTRFAPEGTSRQAGLADFVEGRLPQRLAGVCLEIGGQRAFLMFVSATQLNAIVPNLASGTQAAVQAVADCGAATERRSAPVSLGVRDASPEFMIVPAADNNKVYIAAADATSGMSILPTWPAKPGEWLTLYGTGLGATSPAVLPGAASAGVAPVASTARVTFGGRELETSSVPYIGLTPGSPGIYQVNLQVPADMPDGDQVVTLEIAGRSASGYLRIYK